MKKYEFQAEVKKTEGVNSGYLEFPFDVEKEFGVKGQVKVKAWFNGVLYRGSLVKMKMPCHIIGLNKEVREKAGINTGDIINVVIERDTEERKVEITQHIQNWLSGKPEVLEYFRKLSYSHQREYIEWITSAKKEETRKKRILQFMEKINRDRRS